MPRRRSQQRGAALVIGLILLLTMTVLGIAGLTSASVELQMAGNAQFHQNAFQAAETGIDDQLVNGVFTAEPQAPITHVITPAISAQTQVTYRAATDIPSGGYSLGGAFSAHHFDIRSDGTAERDARSLHEQGIFVIGPAAAP